jgi:hypothetical protein
MTLDVCFSEQLMMMAIIFPNLSLKIGQKRYLNLMKGKNFNKDNLNILSQIIFMEAIH